LKCGSKNDSFVGPIVGQMGQRTGFGVIDGALAANRKMNPIAATRAAADKANIGPPGFHKRIVDRTTEGLQAEVDGLQIPIAPIMRTTVLTVYDMRRHGASRSFLSIQGVHCF
jgi:hypothetical protein